MFGKKTLISVLFVGFFAYYLTRPKIVREGKLIETKSGAVKGIISVSRDGREFYEWAGIPFAQAPVGKLRFASPQPVEKWDGVLDASKEATQCSQNLIFYTNFVTGDEDCLFLNVNTPKQLHDEKKVLPVVVYIPGGGYVVGGSAMYRPEFFMDEDVIYVTFQYRIGIFGFLTTGDKAIRGNMGLKDQVQALKWVKENIHSFGGDSNRITIFGHSAGGASVHQQLLSPMAKGLFHRAISLSGAATNTWGLKSPSKAIEQTKSIAKAVNCPIDETEELVECLRSKSVKELLDTVMTDMYDHPLFKPNKFGEPTVPTVEQVDDDEAFLAHHPLDLVAQGKAQRVPWMVGYTADEGLVSIMLLKTNDEALQELEDNWEKSYKNIFAIEDSNSNTSSRDKVSRIRDFYFPRSRRLGFTREEKLREYTKLFGDAFFNFDIRQSISYQRQFSPVYPYFYSKTDGPSISEMMVFIMNEKFTEVLSGLLYVIKTIVGQSYFGMEPPQDEGEVTHAGDMVQLFAMNPVIQLGKNSKYYEFSKSYVKLIVDFATNELTDLSFRGVKFPPTPKQGPLKFLEITNDVPKITTEPFEDRMKFLKDLQIRKLSSK